MSSKFLHSLADENPEFKRQIGCMTGIIQMFDRQHVLTGKRPSAHSNKKLTADLAGPCSKSSAKRHDNAPSRNVLEKNHSKSSNENQRASVESSRTSFSSSSCSSFSSLDFCKSTQPEAPSSVDPNYYGDRSPYDPPVKKNSSIPDIKVARHEFLSDPVYAPIQSGRLSLDFRDVVKDSIYKDNPVLSVRTSMKEEKRSNSTKYRDSPRLMQSLDGSYAAGIGGKPRLPDDPNESLQLLVKLKEVPWYYSDSTDTPRISYESRDGSYLSMQKEAPRFSFDGKGSRPSLDSRDSCNPSFKLRELPRLSLDSREGSIRGSYLDSIYNSTMRDANRSSPKVALPSDNKNDLLGSNTRLPSVVVKLMGVEAMPMSSSPVKEQVCLSENHRSRNFASIISVPKDNNTLIIAQDMKDDRLTHSPISSLTKASIALREKHLDPVKKPLCNSRIPVEVAPWRQDDRIHVPQKAKFGYREPLTQHNPETIYSEIEKRLKDVEFRQSNKDLRALKQIFGAIQAKELLETEKDEDQTAKATYQDTCTENTQTSRSASTRKVDTPPLPRYTKGSSISRGLESPIVIMKPAKSLERSGISPSTVIPLEDLSTLPNVRTSVLVEKKKTLVSSRLVKGQSVKAKSIDLTSQPIILKDKKYKEENPVPKAHSRTSQSPSRLQDVPRDNHGNTKASSPRPSELTRENSGSSVKSSNSLSPRLQQKKLEMEKRSRPPLHSAEPNKPKQQQANRHTLESVSPRNRLRQKASQAHEKDRQLGDNNSGTQSLIQLGDEASLKSDSHISSSSEVDAEVRSYDQQNLLSLQQDNQSPGRSLDNATSNLNQKMSICCSNERTSATETESVTPEQPSPVSVLDSSFYPDLSSPEKTHPVEFQGDEVEITVDCCSSVTPDSESPKFSSGFNQKKLERIENLVLQLSQLSAANDATPGTDHIASLCKTQNPDHRYVSEILLASGLLMKDFTSGPLSQTSIQLHPSGHPINPDLFLVLEQTKCGALLKPGVLDANSHKLKSDTEKLHRKLVFDFVNELLIQKLDLAAPSLKPNRLIQARNVRLPSGQCLLKELCSDIEQLESESNAATDTCEDDSTMTSSNKDLICQLESWTDLGNEFSTIVRDVERMIFKDLIDEVVMNGEATWDSLVKATDTGRRRQLFAK